MLDFYFDFISPYAYLAWANPRTGPRALAARHGQALAIHPVLFAGLLARWGQLGPAEVPPKRAFLVKDVMRHAALESIPVAFPALHPFNPLTLLRLALPGPDQIAIIDAMFELRAWVSRGTIPRDLPRRSQLRAHRPRARRRRCWSHARANPTREAALVRATEAAAARGVFGVPTVITGDELFWGSDRASDVERCLAGTDPVDHALAAAVIARPLRDGSPQIEAESRALYEPCAARPAADSLTYDAVVTQYGPGRAHLRVVVRRALRLRVAELHQQSAGRRRPGSRRRSARWRWPEPTDRRHHQHRGDPDHRRAERRARGRAGRRDRRRAALRVHDDVRARPQADPRRARRARAGRASMSRPCSIPRRRTSRRTRPRTTSSTRPAPRSCGRARASRTRTRSA